MLETIAFVLFVVIALFGIGLAALGLPGTFVVLGGALLYDLVTWSWTIGGISLALIAGLAILGEGLDFAVAYLTHKRSGSSTYALVGTILGALIGAWLLSIVPILGTIIGLVLGAFLGAYLAELLHTRNSSKSWKAAKAALVSRGIIMLAKFSIAIGQTLLVLHLINT